MKDLYEKCPRCKGESVELGSPLIDIGKTRRMRVSLKLCPKCCLLFYEGSAKSFDEGKTLGDYARELGVELE